MKKEEALVLNWADIQEDSNPLHPRWRFLGAGVLYDTSNGQVKWYVRSYGQTREEASRLLCCPHNMSRLSPREIAKSLPA